MKRRHAVSKISEARTCFSKIFALHTGERFSEGKSPFRIVSKTA